jgi:hypothetical protein
MEFDLKVREIKLSTYILTGKINNKEIINNLINFIKNNKDESVSGKTNVKGHHTGFSSLIQNKDFHEFLKLIDPQIKSVYNKNFIIHNVWGNLLKENEEVTEHTHNDATAFCGILYLTEGGPGTYFKDFDTTVEEEVGKYVLFHPFLMHSVEKIKKNLERITVAWNFLECKNWEINNNNTNWVNKNI